MIHLIVGNTGAGKTTYAIELRKKTGGIIFSIDEWNNTLFFKDKTENDKVDWILERIERIEEMIIKLITQLEEVNVDVILDLGLSKKSHRDKFRKFAANNGLKTQLHFLDYSKDLRQERVMKRNTEKGETYMFEVSPADFDFMETWFEPPQNEELLGAIHLKD